MKKCFIIVALFLLSAIPSLAEAAVHYVRAGATGNGSDWANAMALPSTLVRGDTYYIAAGSYGGRTFSDPLAGSAYIYLRKATASDHGTEAGWNAAYAGPATFGNLTFNKGYYDLDGRVGGGPTSWRSGHGFKIASVASGTGALINLGNVTGIRIRHAEIYFSNLVGASTSTAKGDLIFGPSGGSDIIIQYCWLHDSARTIFYPTVWSNLTFEYNMVERHGVNWGSDNHSEIFSARQVTNFTVRYNHFVDWKSTGGLIFGGVVSSAAQSISSNLFIYGNVFEWSKNLGDTANNGVIGSWSHSWMGVTNAKVFNNTFVNITDANPSDAASIFPMGNLTNVVVMNNIWYNANPKTIRGTHDYNFFDSHSHGEAHAQVSTANPFLNYAGKDYRLRLPTVGVSALTSPFNIDMLGILRGADGIWDRGAYEYGGAPVPVPSIPVGITVN